MKSDTSATHICCFPEGPELLLLEGEPAEGQRRVPVIVQLGLDLLNLLITLRNEATEGERRVSTHHTADTPSHEVKGVYTRARNRKHLRL